MQITHLGRTGLKVSRLCLGTMNFGPRTTQKDSHAIMDEALNLGINFFDTADVYGGKPGEGATEQIVGKWIAKGGSRRDDVVLATKVYNPMNRKDKDDPNKQRGLSALKIIKACEASLKRLQTDYIDLYQMHHVDRECPWEEIWQAMETLVKQGKILYCGSSNFAGWHIAMANEAAKSRNFMGLVCEQSKFSLLTRHCELEVIPACQKYGLGVIAWSPLAGGMLGGISGKLDKGSRRSAQKENKVFDKHKKQLEKWESLCKQQGEKPADMALAWVLHQPGLTGPIIGPRTMKQLKGAVRATEIELDEKTLKKIDDIFPGYGKAPESYAW